MANMVAAHAVSLTTNLAHQLEQASELRNLSYSVIVTDGIRDLKINEHIALAMFYRSLQTHEAIEILLRRELVEDAEALVRVLVENEVNCAYMLVVGDEETARDFIRYPRFKNYVLMRGLKAVDETRFPRGSVENRPTGVTSKPANGVAQDVVLIYPAFS
jgi:hypothetical protein